MSSITLNPYLTFDDNCREAMEYYHKILGGKLEIQTFGEAMPDTPEDQKDKIMHAYLKSEDVVLMASDSMPGQPPKPGNNVSLALNGNDSEHLTKAFEALAEDGEITMPLEKQFWGDTFGMLKDKFGIHWMVDISKE